jgi:hypothetical protein
MFEPSKTRLACHLAGFAYGDGLTVFNELEIGMALELRAEPDNPFDPQAIALYYGACRIGHIPRKHTHQFIQYLELGHDDLFEARINRISPDHHPEGQVGITILIRDARVELSE